MVTRWEFESLYPADQAKTGATTQSAVRREHGKHLFGPTQRTGLEICPIPIEVCLIELCLIEVFPIEVCPMEVCPMENCPINGGLF